MKRTVVNGIIKKWKEYEGRAVDLITKRKGLFGRKFEQILEGADMSSIEMPYSRVAQINHAYRIIESQLQQ